MTRNRNRIPKFPKFQLNIETPKESKNSFDLLTTVLIPIIISILVVQINQCNYTENRRLENHQNILFKDMERELPILNRIMLFNNNVDLYSTASIIRNVDIVNYLDENGKVVKIDSLYRPKLNDTTIIVTFNFVANKEARDHFNNEVLFLKNNLQYLDFSVQIEVQESIDFLVNNPLPEVGNENDIEKSNWNTQKIIKKWLDLTQKQTKAASKKLDTYHNYLINM